MGIVSDLTACPKCGGKLKWDYAHRHLGHATCRSAAIPAQLMRSFSVEPRDWQVCEVRSTATRVHNIQYKSSAATLSSTSITCFVAIVTAREMGLAPATIMHLCNALTYSLQGITRLTTTVIVLLAWLLRARMIRQHSRHRYPSQ